MNIHVQCSLKFRDGRHIHNVLMDEVSNIAQSSKSNTHS